MTARNQTTSLFVIAFAASVLLWPTLIAASWLYMPPFLAAISSAIHLVGMIATAGPSIAYLCSSVARARKRRACTRLTSSGGRSLFPSRAEAREENLKASRITSLGSGFNHRTTSTGEDVLPLIRARAFSDQEGHPDPLDIPTIWRLTPEDREAGFDNVAPMPVALDLSKPDPEEAA
jgi:hypothetical protein